MNMENSIGHQENRERGRGRKAFWIIIGAALLIGVVSATWSPQHRQFRTPGAHSAALEWNVERVLDAIDATEEQRLGLQPVLERARTEVQQITLAERELRVVLMAALEANEFDPEEVSRLRTRAIRLSESAIDAVAESTVEIWSVLTPEQRADVLRHWKRRS
jgi:Spy/CpxP family protein refolding chaperone